jgi:hypothetical protein
MNGSGKILWVLFSVNLNPSNQISPSVRSAVVMGYVSAPSLSELQEIIHQWVAKTGGKVVELLDYGDLEQGIPILGTLSMSEFQALQSVSQYSFQEMLQATQTLGQAHFQVLAVSKQPIVISLKPPNIHFVETLSDALNFFRSHRLTVYPLEMEVTRSIRQTWRQKYLSRTAKFSHSAHACRGCSSRVRKGGARSFDWDNLNEQLVKPFPKANFFDQRNQHVVLFFERCDLPAFSCPMPVLLSLTEDLPLCDLYISPFPRLHWTIVYTHEALCGPYFLESP